MIAKIFKRICKLFTNPDEALHFIKAEHIKSNLILKYISIMALFTFVGNFIRETLIGINVGELGVQKIPYQLSLVGNIVLVFLTIAVAFLIMLVIKILSAHFNSVKSRNKSLKLILCFFMPLLVAGFFRIIPYFEHVAFAAGLVFSIYIIYKGLPIILETTKDKVVMFTSIITIVWLVLYFIVWLISRYFIYAPYL